MRREGVILIVILLIGGSSLVTGLVFPQFHEEKNYTGNLSGIKRYPQQNGWDIVLLFNNDTEYLVISEYKTGIMVELEPYVGYNVTVYYNYYPVDERNVIQGFKGDI
jgi:hypothetical protein